MCRTGSLEKCSGPTGALRVRGSAGAGRSQRSGEHPARPPGPLHACSAERHPRAPGRRRALIYPAVARSAKAGPGSGRDCAWSLIAATDYRHWRVVSDADDLDGNAGRRRGYKKGAFWVPVDETELRRAAPVARASSARGTNGRMSLTACPWVPGPSALSKRGQNPVRPYSDSAASAGSCSPLRTMRSHVVVSPVRTRNLAVAQGQLLRDVVPRPGRSQDGSDS